MSARRAQVPMPVVVFIFLGTLVAAALLYVFLQQAFGPMIGIASDAANTSAAKRGLNTIAKPAWNNWAMWVGIGVMVLGVAGAAAARRVS